MALIFHALKEPLYENDGWSIFLKAAIFLLWFHGGDAVKFGFGGIKPMEFLKTAPSQFVIWGYSMGEFTSGECMANLLSFWMVPRGAG